MPRATPLLLPLLMLLMTLLALAACAHGARSHRNTRRPHHDGAGRQRRAGWSCPIVPDAGRSPALSCQCDLAHTLRCTSASPTAADPIAAEEQVVAIVGTLRVQPRERFVSLLDLSIQNLSRLAARAFDKLPLHGLVVTSGEIVDVAPDAFAGLGPTLTALGLPNNRLAAVPQLKSLKHLERLDLSNNKIRAIAGDPFAGLDRLRSLDLSGNGLETLGPSVFRAPSPLRSLHLGSNRLDAAQLDGGALGGLKKLQEIDLSANRLRGRLTSSFLQGLDSLVTLDLTANNFTLLKRGMLSALRRLHTLRLARNQIDVIEDQSFVALTSLTTLDLSHNGVVAISGQSLSHLDNLSQLDLSHNYLRAVTADLVNGLPRLESLDLTDNDIASVEPGVLARLPKLVHLLLTDNPLNCDCHSLELAAWLRNGTGNGLADEANRKTAVCATPPSLENALLHETDAGALTCESAHVTHSAEEDADEGSSHFLSSQPTEDFIRLSSAQVQFVSAELEGSSLLHTVWTVDSATLPYTCDAILVYELSEEHEALLDSYPVRCHSEERPNKDLRLTVKLGDNMKPDGQYRLCLVLFEGGHDDEASLLPGCSHSMTWQTLRRIPDYSDEVDQLDAFEASPTQITAFYANVSTSRSVSVYMRILDAARDCQFTVVVFQSHRLLARQQLNCSATWFTFGQMAELHELNDDDPLVPVAADYATGEYQVCATFDRHGEFLPPPDGERQADGDIILTASRQFAEASSINSSIVHYEHCVVAKMPPARTWAVENTLVVIAVTVIFVLIAAALLLVTYLLARRVFFRRSKLLWCHSSDPLGSSVPKATSRHILYVPESDYFTDSSSSYSSADGREETSTNV